MQVFKPANENHILKVIPLINSEQCTINLRHELTDVITSIDIPKIYCENGYYIMPFAFTFKEGGSYHVEVISDLGTIFRGKAYATDFNDIENYKLL